MREKAAETLPADEPDPQREEKVAEAIGRAYLDLYPSPAVATASYIASGTVIRSAPYGSGRALGGIPPGVLGPAPTAYTAVDPEDFKRFLAKLNEPPDQFADRILLGSNWLSGTNVVEDQDEEETGDEDSSPATKS